MEIISGSKLHWPNIDSERRNSKIEQETGTRNLLTEKDQARIRLGLNWDQPPDGSIPATDA